MSPPQPTPARTASYEPLTVSGLFPGTYRVSVTTRNKQTTWYVNAATFATATPVTVGSGQTKTGVDISAKGKPKA